jgi:hypothetical protein
MNWMTIETQTRVVGVLAVLFILYSLWMVWVKAPELPEDYANPVLALELAENGSDIDTINSLKDGEAAKFIKEHLPKDFGYIVIYVVFFSCLALLLAELVSNRSRYLALGAVACAVLTGVFDVIENVGMLKAVSTTVGTATDSLAIFIRYPSLAKWALLFVFCLLVGITFSRREGWLLIPGLAFLIAGIVGLSGVALNLLRPKSYWMFSASIGFMGLGIICIAVIFTLWPPKVLNKFFADS